MTEIKSRGMTLDVKDMVSLTVAFRDSNGTLVDADSFPTISISQPSGNVLFSATTAGVAHDSTGKYSYIFQIPLNGPYGVWNDTWVAMINGFRVETTFSFVVVKTDVPAINSDGYFHLGDIYPLTYSQTAIQNINKLLRMLKARLNSSGKAPLVVNGNVTYVDCDIFSIDMLVTFLSMSLSDFNQIPYFSSFTFDDTEFVKQFAEVLVEGATIYSLASQALIERGREFTITDNSINFNPPSVAEILQTQQSTLLTLHFDKLKLIKNSIRPAPLGLARADITSGITPAVKRLSNLRARRLI